MSTEQFSARQLRKTSRFKSWQKRARKNLIDTNSSARCKLCKDKDTDNLTLHHKVELSKLLVVFKVQSCKQARQCEALWDTKNLAIVCSECHEELHGQRRWEQLTYSEVA